MTPAYLTWKSAQDIRPTHTPIRGKQVTHRERPMREVRK